MHTLYAEREIPMDSNEFDSKLRAVPDGGVTSAAGFIAAGVHAGFRKNPERGDFALVLAERPVAAAGPSPPTGSVPRR